MYVDQMIFQEFQFLFHAWVDFGVHTVGAWMDTLSAVRSQLVALLPCGRLGPVSVDTYLFLLRR